jgi:hypothetical protein
MRSPAHESRASTSRLPQLAAVPSFACAGGYEVLDEPFRERLRVVQGAPGDAELSTRLTVARVGAPVLVHWEVARDARFLDIERYGLFFAHHQLDYQVRVGLQGLSPGRGYWARLWAGGSWSPTVRVHTESYAMQFARARATHSTRPLRRVLDGVGSVRGISLLPRGRGRPHARTNTGPGSPGADGTGGSLIGAGSSFGGSSSGRGSDRVTDWRHLERGLVCRFGRRSRRRLLDRLDGRIGGFGRRNVGVVEGLLRARAVWHRADKCYRYAASLVPCGQRATRAAVAPACTPQPRRWSRR